MLALKTPLKNAEKVKRFLTKNNLINKNYKIAKGKNHLYFPLLKRVNLPETSVTQKTFPKIITGFCNINASHPVVPVMVMTKDDFLINSKLLMCGLINLTQGNFLILL